VTPERTSGSRPTAPCGETREPAPAQLAGGQEASVRGQVGGERMIDSSRYVPGNPVQGFDLSREPFRRPCIHQQSSRILERPQHIAAVSTVSGRRRTVNSGSAPRGAGAGSPTSTAPPAATQALKPPSSTATGTCPSHLKSHHARAANEPFESS